MTKYCVTVFSICKQYTYICLQSTHYVVFTRTCLLAYVSVNSLHACCHHLFPEANMSILLSRT